MILINPSFEMADDFTEFEAYKKIESAGRVAYKSEDRITEDSAPAFVKGLIKRGHESVLEHVAVSCRFTVDRGVTHELVRHRLASFTQESTRYCNYKGGVTFIIPSNLTDVFEAKEYDIDWINNSVVSTASQIWFESMARAERNYQNLIVSGWTPQQARSILPNSLKTEIVVTANIREWRHIFKLRCAKTAHPDMVHIMSIALTEFYSKYPVLFEDLRQEFLAS